MNNVLKEEIERFKLLSKYDNKKTLNENYISNVLISEDKGQGLLRILSLGTKELESASKTAVKELENIFHLAPKEMKKYGNDAAEIVAKLEAKAFTREELGALRKDIFKSTTDLNLKREIAEDMTKSKNFKEFFMSHHEDEIIEELVKNKNYTYDEAYILTEKYKSQGGKFKERTNLPKEKEIKKTTEPEKPRTKSTDYGSKPQRKTYAEIAWGMFTDIAKGSYYTVEFVVKNFWRLLWIAGTIGIVYYLWNYMNQKYKVYPKCLSPDNIPKDDWNKMFNQQLQYVKKSDTGNEFVDSNGGGRFYSDKKFETDNEKFKGTWSEEPDGDILVKLSNGDEHVLLCENLNDFEDETDTRPEDDKSLTKIQTEKEKIISKWDGEFKECREFPMSIGCTNRGIIGTVQDCLDIPRDGKFTLEVLDALEKNGYGLTLTFDSYKKIQEKCGMGKEEGVFSLNI